MIGTPTGKFPKTAHLLKRADFQRVYQQGRRHFSGNMTVFYLARRSPEANAEPGIAMPASLDRRSPQTRRSRIAAEKLAEQSPVRVGFTVPKAIGKSVDRNRIRRKLREAVRHHLGELTDARGVDVVFNPKRSALAAEFAALSKEVERAFEVIRKNPQAKRSNEASR